MAGGPLLAALTGLWRLRSTPATAGPVLRGERVHLRWPQAGDHAAWSRLRGESRDHLTPWEPAWPRDALSVEAFRRRLRAHRQDIRTGTGYMFLVFRNADDALLGGASLSQVRRGAGASAEIGYWLGQAHAGQGHMTEAVQLLLAHSYEGLQLRRLEAACLPDNQRSKALLARLGFRREGLARSYLCIAGRWRDHELHALLVEDWLATKRAGAPPGRDACRAAAAAMPGSPAESDAHFNEYG